MKLLRYGEPGQERPGLLDSTGRIRDLTDLIGDLSGTALSPESIAHLQSQDIDSLPLVEGSPRIGPCVGQIGKFICIGLNYADHAAETGAAIPKEPIMFMKATSAIVGPNDDVVIPRGFEEDRLGSRAGRGHRQARRVMSTRPTRWTMSRAIA